MALVVEIKGTERQFDSNGAKKAPKVERTDYTDIEITYFPEGAEETAKLATLREPSLIEEMTKRLREETDEDIERGNIKNPEVEIRGDSTDWVDVAEVLANQHDAHPAQVLAQLIHSEVVKADHRLARAIELALERDGIERVSLY